MSPLALPFKRNTQQTKTNNTPIVLKQKRWKPREFSGFTNIEVGEKMMHSYLLPIYKYKKSWFFQKFWTNTALRRLCLHPLLWFLTSWLRRCLIFLPSFTWVISSHKLFDVSGAGGAIWWGGSYCPGWNDTTQRVQRQSCHFLFTALGQANYYCHHHLCRHYYYPYL